MPELFNPIGDKVEKVAPAAAQESEDDERVVEEIESLCMNCEENVSLPLEPTASRRIEECGLLTSVLAGRNAAPPY